MLLLIGRLQPRPPRTLPIQKQPLLLLIPSSVISIDVVFKIQKQPLLLLIAILATESLLRMYIQKQPLLLLIPVPVTCSDGVCTDSKTTFVTVNHKPVIKSVSKSEFKNNLCYC